MIRHSKPSSFSLACQCTSPQLQGLQFIFVQASVVSYTASLLPLCVPHIFFFLVLGSLCFVIFAFAVHCTHSFQRML